MQSPPKAVTATVLTAHIQIQSDGLQITCTSPGGDAFAFCLEPHGTISDLEDQAQCTCTWDSCECLSEDGAIPQKHEALTGFKELVIYNSQEQRLQYWKDRYQLAGKILAAMSTEAFNPSSNTCNWSWSPQSSADVDPEEFDRLIWQFYPDSLSVHKRANFLQVLGHLVTNSEPCQMLRLSFIQHVDPGMKRSKHEACAWFLELSRYSASQPVGLEPPPFLYLCNMNWHTDWKMASLDTQVPLSSPLLSFLEVNDAMRLNLDHQTHKSLSAHLAVMDGDIDGCRCNMAACKQELIISKTDSLRLLHTQLRLASGLCPVVVRGCFSHGLLALLAGTQDYQLKTLSTAGSPRQFTAVPNPAVQEGTCEERLGDDVDLQMQTEKSLQEHAREAATAAFNSDARGCLVVVTCLADAVDDVYLHWMCRRLQQSTLPCSVRFLLCEGSSTSASNVRAPVPSPVPSPTAVPAPVPAAAPAPAPLPAPASPARGTFS